MFQQCCIFWVNQLKERSGSPQSSRTENSKKILREWLRFILILATIVCIFFLLWSFDSVIIHWGRWAAPVFVQNDNPHCDPLDTTECSFPFPSFYFMKEDSTTSTGYRVNLQGDMLPLLRGKNKIDPSFLNSLDGFSTMGPILFYVEGLKEAYEADVKAIKNDNTNATIRASAKQLCGPADIKWSITNRSITFLIDVKSNKLIPHSAEVDYLDEKRPSIMVFPAQPLRHNTHYALAVIGATTDFSRGSSLLPATDGMKKLLGSKYYKSNSKHDIDSNDPTRKQRYIQILIPALETAAPWFSFEKETESLQLLFDFLTISEMSQLGPVRAVRDATLATIKSPDWGDWTKNGRVRVTKKIDNNCYISETLIARTIHAELDVPWFLNGFGPGYRGSFLDAAAVATGIPNTIGKASFVVHIPCSIRAAAINEPKNGASDAKPLRAILEYGHGIFGNRGESMDDFLVRMANKNGYIITAMDWRGMSAYDLPVVIQVLLSSPRTFQSVRDNLIQGYANKFALQHFSRHGMLSMANWFDFSSISTGDNNQKQSQIERNNSISILPTYNNVLPTSIFYGISQGGILGAGYTVLSSPTALIDRSVLGVPGTPFSLILARSVEFEGYDFLLMLNFYNNRHVRMFLSLAQMCWDSVEGSGVLAKPLSDDGVSQFPKTLIQAGLGDVSVPSLAAEALARGMGASTLPFNPRQDIFGIPTSSPANETWSGPHVTITELLYEEEYRSLPVNDIFPNENNVHSCMRLDSAMVAQVEEFVNTGRVINPCEIDRCIRLNSHCWV